MKLKERYCWLLAWLVVVCYNLVFTTTDIHQKLLNHEDSNKLSEIQALTREPCVDETSTLNWVNLKISAMERLKIMNEEQICLSLKQQDKFFKIKDKVLAWTQNQVEKSPLLYADVNKIQYAVPITDKYAYRHIFKNGGTTINAVTQNKHIERENLDSNSKLFTLVRDPIDHFLSGWAECGFRARKSDDDPEFANNPAFAKHLDINEQIQHWVKCVKGATLKGGNMRPCRCSKHSYPQANFLLDNDEGKYIIDPKIEVVGELKELPQLLEMVGFQYGKALLPTARDASMNLVKVENFPKDKTKLSDETLQLVCDFVILDYYFFHFEPPEVCRDQITADIASIQNVSL